MLAGANDFESADKSHNYNEQQIASAAAKLGKARDSEKRDSSHFAIFIVLISEKSCPRRRANAPTAE
jgi:hypothetical protein